MHDFELRNMRAPRYVIMDMRKWDAVRFCGAGAVHEGWTDYSKPTLFGVEVLVSANPRSERVVEVV